MLFRSQNLLQLYLYVNREVARAALRGEEEHLENVRPVLEKLATAYRQIEGQDVTGPIMGNAQTVYAGLTYGRDTLTENMANPAANRGFCV